MIRKTILLIIVSMLILTMALYGCKKKEGKEEVSISIQGSTTVLPIMQKMAEVYMQKHPEAKLDVSGGGSGVGITAFLDGTTDIAMSSRKIKPEEMQKAKDKGIPIKEIEIARDGIAVIIHPSNTISGLSIEQLHDIYTGSIKSWKDVGGNDKTIVVVSRDTASGTYEVFDEKVLKNDRVKPDALMQASNVAVKGAVAGAEDSIGYIGLGYITSDVKPIKINNIEVTKETVLSGEYPIARPLYLYIKENSSQGITNLIDFILSPEGQKIVEDVGFIPIK